PIIDEHKKWNMDFLIRLNTLYLIILFIRGLRQAFKLQNKYKKLGSRERISKAWLFAFGHQFMQI
ncbi:MAG: hypothetical protein ACI901_001840, partial [Octadecabacter sp.]